MRRLGDRGERKKGVCVCLWVCLFVCLWKLGKEVERKEGMSHRAQASYKGGRRRRRRRKSRCDYLDLACSAVYEDRQVPTRYVPR